MGEHHVADDYQMPTGTLMKGKRGVITGVANHQSIAWGIASQLAAQGADLAFMHLPGMERRVTPLAESVNAKLIVAADVTDDASMDEAFGAVAKTFGQIDFFLHAIAFANKDELKGSFVDNTTREGFLRAMNISAFSFVDCARRAAALMPEAGGSIVTLTYMGSERAIPNYNTMGVAKAALEAATRYAARDLGPKGIRVNALSPGAMKTLSLAGISGGRGMLAKGRSLSAMKEDTSMEGVAGAALWLMSDLGKSTTGEVIHVDAGFHIMGFSDDEDGEG
ncbi:MAG: enoyl-ACP reductase [Phenylobacterium sp. RIFCSPHIGHO2_01_FULL_69_31]|jgi:enoyl-[acyl-carrier protein] reductase I|nr:MAG: enoyl-ACP reductase [Phenylobacterium sp. RIFCSPHIGHO2_01_FULL_69_31]